MKTSFVHVPATILRCLKQKDFQISMSFDCNILVICLQQSLAFNKYIYRYTICVCVCVINFYFIFNTLFLSLSLGLF